MAHRIGLYEVAARAQMALPKQQISGVRRYRLEFNTVLKLTLRDNRNQAGSTYESPRRAQA